jgi:glycosyltransferase involved in cell wall biosynthesis
MPMLRITVFTLTRDRRDYTRICFDSLRANAGFPFAHYVVDNGSTDGTKRWLRNSYKPDLLVDLPSNVGISRACNLALQIICRFGQSDLVVKFDNDCLVRTAHILKRIQGVYDSGSTFLRPLVLSPRVSGIVNQPKRLQLGRVGGLRVGWTSIIGGLFHCVPAYLYTSYRYPENLPLASGQDDHFCAWMRRRGVACGYLEDLEVEHFETTPGQAARYPDYFARKHRDERRGR